MAALHVLPFFLEKVNLRDPDDPALHSVIIQLPHAIFL